MVKHGTRIVPSPEARVIYPDINKLFDAYDAVQRRAADLRSDSSGTVAIAAIPTQATRYAAQAIKLFRLDFPTIMVKLHILCEEEIISSVLSGKVDFGMIHSMDVVPDDSRPELRVDDFGEQPILCIAPLGHRFSKRNKVTLDDLSDETYVSHGRESSFTQWLERAFDRSGVKVDTTVEVGATHSLIEVVRIGTGVGLVESGALSPLVTSSLVVRPLSPALYVRSRVIRRNGSPLSRCAERMLTIYRNLVYEDAVEL